MLLGFREIGRVLRGARRLGQARRLERRGRLPDARVALLNALSLVEGIRGGLFYSPAASTTRLFAYLALARIAREMEDAAEAACYARKWLAAWSEFRLSVPELRRDGRFQRLVEWESWARQHVAWWEAQKVHPTMKLDFVEHAETTRSAGPLIRFSGRDGQVVGALRRAVAGLSHKPLALHAIRGIEQIDGCHLAVVKGNRRGGVERIGLRSFVWEMDAAGWDRVVEILASLENPDQRDGFHFLSCGNGVAILISTDGRW